MGQLVQISEKRKSALIFGVAKRCCFMGVMGVMGYFGYGGSKSRSYSRTKATDTQLAEA